MRAELWAEIKRLYQIEKLPIAEIARRMRMDRKTVRHALRSERLPCMGHFQRRPSKLDAFTGYIQERLREYPKLAGSVLLREIQRQGYTGKIRILNKYLAGVRERSKEVFLRIETPPGRQAQVDWANCGSVVIGQAVRKLSCFVMVLSYSRQMYLEFTLSQCQEDFIRCHLNAFKYFGGIAQKILYDNLKLVVLSRVGGYVQFNPKFMEFAAMMGFEPVLCNVARGNEKGKVESGINYIRISLLEGRRIRWPQIQEDGHKWLEETANARLHRTTRERPVDRWEREKPHLCPLPSREYDASIFKMVGSTHQALVRFDGNLYTVGPQWAYKKLQLRATQKTVRILDEDKVIAEHKRSYDRGALVENPEHLKGVLALKRRAQADRFLKSFMELGPIAGEYLKGLSDTEVRIGRHVARIMELVATYGKSDVLEAMTHAHKCEAFGAAYVQSILLQKRSAQGLKEILPIEIPHKPAWNEIITEEPDLSIYDKLIDDDNK